jgi:hypothetical protein
MTHRVSIRIDEEDAAWLAGQAHSLGLDGDAAVVRMLVRQARLSGVSLAVVMQGAAAAQAHAPRRPAPARPRLVDTFDLPAVMRAAEAAAHVAGESGEESEAEPVAPEVVDDVLAARLAELAVGPPIAAASGPEPVAVSLRQAPKRAARDYR